jgi:UDP-glucose 4-epimerase
VAALLFLISGSATVTKNSADANTIIVLGGAGYIGSHCCKLLRREGFTPVVIDNLSRGHRRAVQWGPLELADIGDTTALVAILNRYRPGAVIHFAALIEVGESVKDPAGFYRNNVVGTLSVLNAMAEAGVDKLVFSSTAAVYGQPETSAPLHEDLPLAPINPYGNSKLAAERMIRDFEMAAGLKSVCLRYFNACGADADGEIGEMHFPETHLMPLVIQTALGLRPFISVYGADYPTKDGTCIRDYIHVDDLASAHVAAVRYLLQGGATMACNLGTGTGFSVREIIAVVRSVCGVAFQVVEAERRPGDPAFLVANNERAAAVLGWHPAVPLAEIARSAFNWHDSEVYRAFWTGRTGPAAAVR